MNEESEGMRPAARVTLLVVGTWPSICWRYSYAPQNRPNHNLPTTERFDHAQLLGNRTILGETYIATGLHRGRRQMNRGEHFACQKYIGWK